MKLKYFALTILFLTITAFSKTFIRGYIVENNTNKKLPEANIFIQDTFLGTSSNDSGFFNLSLPKIPIELTIKYIGYKSKKISVNDDFDFDTDLIIRMDKEDILLPEITYTYRNPAIQIIKKAIIFKETQEKRLTRYQAIAYNKYIFRNDTQIVSINESVDKIFWTKDSLFSEKHLYQKSTGNMKFITKYLNIRNIPNFYNDNIKIKSFDFVSPLNRNSLDYYDFEKEEVIVFDNRRAFVLKVIPKSQYQPLFKGKIVIQDSSYALISANLKIANSNIFKFPIKSYDLSYNQFYNNYESDYFLPTKLNIDGKITISPIPGLKFPSFIFKQKISITDYLFDNKRESLSLNRDTILAHYRIPLTVEEVNAYRMIDKNLTLNKAFKPEGALAKYIVIENSSTDEVASNSIFKYKPIVKYNRVSGVNIGANLEFNIKNLDFIIGSSYPFSRGKVDLFSKINYHINKNYQILSEYSNRIKEQSFFSVYSNSYLPSIFSFLLYDDYYDYYNSERFVLKFKTHFDSFYSTFNLSYNNETCSSVSKETDYTVLKPDIIKRINPKINGGVISSINCSYIFDTNPDGDIKNNQFKFAIISEFSDKEFLKSDFSFLKYRLSSLVRLNTFFYRKPKPNYLKILFIHENSLKDFPVQRASLADGSVGFYSRFGTFRSLFNRAIKVKELYSIHAEYNFQDFFFELLNLNTISNYNIELSLLASYGKYKELNKNNFSEISEFGASLNNIFGFVNLNSIYSYKDHNFRFGLGFIKEF